MTPELYAQTRLLILEDAMRNLMAMLAAASPAISVDIDIIGRNWDHALDRLDHDRAAQAASHNTGGKE
jgi:hypothetical protein